MVWGFFLVQITEFSLCKFSVLVHCNWIDPTFQVTVHTSGYWTPSTDMNGSFNGILIHFFFIYFYSRFRPNFSNPPDTKMFSLLIIFPKHYSSVKTTTPSFLQVQTEILFVQQNIQQYSKMYFLFSCTKDASTPPATWSSIPCMERATSTAPSIYLSPPRWQRSWTGCLVGFSTGKLYLSLEQAAKHTEQGLGSSFCLINVREKLIWPNMMQAYMH